jgi:hypothetical protein
MTNTIEGDWMFDDDEQYTDDEYLSDSDSAEPSSYTSSDNSRYCRERSFQFDCNVDNIK